MRSIAKLMQDWQFTGPDGKTTLVELPHTWNAKDGQDGGNDYWRGTCTYSTTFAAPAFDAASQEVWLQFEGVNSSAKVLLNGRNICTHDGGYSTFRVHVSDLLAKDNQLTVEVDNSINDHIYPQKADFTFYGGIYRDISLMVVSKNHIALGHFGDTGVKITPALKDGKADIRVETIVEGEGAVSVELQDAAGSIVARAEGADAQLHLDAPHLWDGVKDPYLYTCVVRLSSDGTVVDEVSTRVGLRTFSVDSKNGFFLNGRPYPLHGVSRHQDRKGVGNAITREMHDEDMALIRELGANTIRLAHYQHDQYFYDLCDQYGMVVWAEIPYISEHLPNGRANTISQMKELIYQNYNHPCIVCWGVSNEITISTKDKADMLDNHRELNDLCEETFGVRPRLFCAHLGATNSIVTAIARAEGVEDCLFAIDACDWSDAYKDKVYQMVYRVTSDRVTSGCVVQFHINGYHTAEVLDKALDNWINVKGLRPVTVGELMQLSGRDFPPLPDYGD